MYNPPQLYIPSKVVRSNPKTLSGLLLVIGQEIGTGTHFFQFTALDSKRLEGVVATFPDPLRDVGRKMVDNSARGTSQNGPKLIYLGGYANTHKLYLSPEITGVDRYPLGIVYDFNSFQRLWLEIAVEYFLEYQQQQKPL